MRIAQTQVDALRVEVYGDRAALGAAAGRAIADTLGALLREKEEVNVIFAAAPSQNETLAYLRACDTVDWRRVNAFHMDEYRGLPADAPQGFACFLRGALWEARPFRRVFTLDGGALDAAAECARYTALLQQYPVDVTCMGVGENGHIAFNDPGVADFDDPQAVKVVPLDEVCRLQQVHDGCFPALADVPTHAFTLTIPALLRARAIFCMVPAASKAQAVARLVSGEVAEDCPATILRRHANATLYLDADSGAALLGERPCV